MIRKLSDAEIEGLLKGRTLTEEGELADLANLLAATRESGRLAPGPAVEQAHLAAIMAATELVPVGYEALPVAKRKRRLGLKIAAGVGGFVLATGGLAAADVLPRPIQDAVAGVAETFGVDLPGATDELNPKGTTPRDTDRKPGDSEADHDEGKGNDDKTPKPDRTPKVESDADHDSGVGNDDKTPRPARTPKVEHEDQGTGNDDKTPKPERTVRPTKSPKLKDASA